MPRYVLPEVSDFEFVNLIRQINTDDKLDNNYVINPNDKNVLLGFLGKHFKLNTALLDDTGGVITHEEKEKGVKRFTETPDIIDIPFKEWDTFRKEIKTLSGGFPGKGFEMGLRLYIGRSSKDVNAEYAVVFVPMYVPVSSTGIYDREKEKEKDLFVNAGKTFFGLLASSSEIGFTKNDATCFSFIREVDERDREVAYFSLDEIDVFIKSLDPAEIFTNLRVEFSRTTNGIATIVLSCRNAGGLEITSSLPIKGPKKAVYFDQGDLIPPPPNDPEGLRNTHFVRKP